MTGTLRCQVDSGGETGFTHQPGLQPVSSLKQLRKNTELEHQVPAASLLTGGICTHSSPLPFLLPPTEPAGCSLASRPGWETSYLGNLVLKGGQEGTVGRGVTYQALLATSLEAEQRKHQPWAGWTVSQGSQATGKMVLSTHPALPSHLVLFFALRAEIPAAEGPWAGEQGLALRGLFPGLRSGLKKLLLIRPETISCPR